MHSIKHETYAEAARLMAVCNACRYCEGICAVFPAMELCKDFEEANLDYLANLCHGCNACFYDCQYAPPHEFNINLPEVFAQVRIESYKAYSWPKTLSGLFAAGLLAYAIAALLATVIFVAVLTLRNGIGAMLFADGGGFFYRLLPHPVMVGIFGAIFAFVLLALTLSMRKFQHAQENTALAPSLTAFSRATHDAGTLRYLGDEGGCVTGEDRSVSWRRLYHHLTFYGFGLCFASTIVATFYHYLLGLEAPYRWFQPPVILGVLGGVALVGGTSGLAVERLRLTPILANDGGLGAPFLLLLWLTGASGLLLLAFRHTEAMGLLLSFHLGVVAFLFLTLPYGKFVHGLYRYAALVRYAAHRSSRSH